MHIMQRLLDAEAGLSLVNKMLVSQPWKHPIQRGSLPKVQAATKELQHVKHKIPLYVCSESLCFSVCCGVLLYLDVDIVISTSIIDRYFCDVLTSKRQAVPWHSHIVAILFVNYHQKSTSFQEAALIKKKKWQTRRSVSNPISYCTKSCS